MCCQNILNTIILVVLCGSWICMIFISHAMPTIRSVLGIRFSWKEIKHSWHKLNVKQRNRTFKRNKASNNHMIEAASNKTILIIVGTWCLLRRNKFRKDHSSMYAWPTKNLTRMISNSSYFRGPNSSLLWTNTSMSMNSKLNPSVTWNKGWLTWRMWCTT